MWWIFLALCSAYGLWLLCGTLERIRALESQLREAEHLLARGCACPLPREAQDAITQAMSEGGFVVPTPRRH